MVRLHRQFIWSVLLVLAIVLNLLNVQVALADDSTPPPPPTEEPTQPPVESAATESPVSVGPSLLPADQPPAEEEPSVSELLVSLPDNTEIIVLDEDGGVVPLATQDAAAIVEVNDPIWCPEGVLPGGAGCSAPYATIEELRSNMVSNTSAYTQNGIIYFTATAGGSLNFSQGTLTGGDYNILKVFNLTFQGGWDGNTVNPTFSGQTNFGSNSFNVGTGPNPWVGNITLKDITFSNGNNTSLTIITSSGNITLDNVDVTNQIGNNAAALTSASGNITIQNNSLFDGDNFNGNGVTATTGSGTITITGATFQQFKRSGGAANTWDGLTLSAPTVSLTNVTSTDNDGDGISITNANIVTLNNVTSSSNGTELGIDGLTGNDGSGVVVSGPAGSIVQIIGGTFNNNQEYGIEIVNPANTALFIQTAPTCTGNDSNAAPTSSCYNITTVTDSTGPVITPSISGTPGSLDWYRSNVSVSWTLSDPESNIYSSTGCSPISLTSETSGTTLTCSATNNAGLSSTVAVTIKIDKTAPSASASALPAANGNGWNNTNVTVSFSGTDGGSGIASCTAPVLLSTEGAGQSATGTCTDLAGNVSSNATASGINIDKTAPTAGASVSPASNGNGWNNSAVTVSFNGADGLSGIASCTAPVVLNTEGAGQSASGSCTDLAGNTSPNATASGINIDLTKPTLNLPANITVQAASSAGVIVTFSASASDNLDSSPSFSCNFASGSTFPIGTTTVNCSSTDQAGNTQTGSFSILVRDSTGPTLSLPANITAEATGASGAVVTFSASASDLVDGPVAVTCIPASGAAFALGNTTINCSATDSNSNTSNGSFTVTVQDTTPPVISPMADVSTSTSSSAGATVIYSSPSTSDLVDGAGITTCTPASGSLFPVGTTTVTCTAFDTAGNSSSLTFNVLVNLNSSSTASQNNLSSGRTIVVTGGEQVNLGCFTELFAFGIKLTFLNLCGHQTVVNSLDQDSLPASLPTGFTFVRGLDVRVLKQGKALEDLPDNTGIKFDFPSPGAGKYALLFWDGATWIEINDSISETELNNLLADAQGDELFRIGSTGNGHSKALTTGPTGIFVLVTK